MVLPDDEAAVDVARRLAAAHGDMSQENYPSGRPWLVGRFGDGQFAVGRSAVNAVAVIGEHAVTSENLAARVAGLERLGDVDPLYADIHGSVHLVACVNGTTRARGTATGLRRIYHTTIGGVPVVSDDASVLAWLISAEPDLDQLAVRLLFPTVPWPLGWESVWAGVTAVPPGHDVELTASEARQVRWWRPPAPERSRAEGAAVLRVALTEAVRARVGSGDRVASHLSGMDSSSLCSIAAREGCDVLALTAAQPDAMDDDVFWAQRTASALRADGAKLRHEVIPAAACPLVYDGLLSARSDLDEPFRYLYNAKRFRDIVRRGQVHAPRVQLMGFGGDEMVALTGQLLPAVLRQAPLRGLRYLVALTARSRGSGVGALGAMLRPVGSAAWLRSAARSLGRHATPAGVKAGPSWASKPVLPTWVTEETVERVRASLRRAATQGERLADDVSTRAMLAVIHTGSQAARGFQRLAAQEGAIASAPFLDDHVMDAVLSVRADGRLDPALYKPLLVEAMRGVVPAATLGRVTKSETSATVVLGSRQHRDQITGLLDDNQLARLGLVDLAALRSALHGVIDVRTPNRRIESTIGVEMWLRNLSEDRHVLLGG